MEWKLGRRQWRKWRKWHWRFANNQNIIFVISKVYQKTKGNGGDGGKNGNGGNGGNGTGGNGGNGGNAGSVIAVLPGRFLSNNSMATKYIRYLSHGTDANVKVSCNFRIKYQKVLQEFSDLFTLKFDAANDNKVQPNIDVPSLVNAPVDLKDVKILNDAEVDKGAVDVDVVDAKNAEVKDVNVPVGILKGENSNAVVNAQNILNDLLKKTLP